MSEPSGLDAAPVTLASSARWTIPPRPGISGLRVTLALPFGKPAEPVPVLVLLDGDFLFLTAVELARTVTLVTDGDLPPLAVVGVMRDEADAPAYIASRFRDFTPRDWVLPGPFAMDNSMVAMGTGGAAGLLDEIEQRVLPGVAAQLARAGLAAGEVTIGGWSLSGLFACWAWLQRPDLFAHLLAISPSLWWDDASLVAAPFARRPVGQRAFVGVGEHEEGDEAKVFPRRFANAEQRALAAMVTNAARFAEMALDAGAEVDYCAVADEHHVTVQAAALARGLRHIFC